MSVDEHERTRAAWTRDTDVLHDVLASWRRSAEVEIVVPVPLAEQAVAAWERDDPGAEMTDEVVARETRLQHAERDGAAALGLLGLRITGHGTRDGDVVRVPIPVAVVEEIVLAVHAARPTPRPRSGGMIGIRHSFGDHEFDDDPGRVDREALWRFLSEDAYWGRQRTRADVEAQLAGAWRVVGVYPAGTDELAGFARAVSDGVAFAYLADVFVLPAHRGHGLGVELVRTMIDDGPGSGFRWTLHTADAHDLYRRFGFREPDPTYLERPRPGSPT